MNDGWNDVRVSRLKALWTQGLSAGDIMPIINREFNERYTRSAIIGKVTRLKLPPRNPMLLHPGQKRNVTQQPRSAAPTVKSAEPPLPDRRAKPKVDTKTKPSVSKPFVAVNAIRKAERLEASPGLEASLEEPAVGSGIQLIDLTSTTCRWPFGDPGTERFYFCGTPGADMTVGRPYCPFHTRKSENPAARSAKEFNRSAMHAASR